MALVVGDIAKLFSKDFLVGFFLPASGFLAGALALYRQFMPPPLPALKSVSTLLQDGQTITLLFIMAWVVAVLLIALNRFLIRLLEGYHLLGRTPLIYLERWRFDRLLKKIEEVEETYREEAEVDKDGEASPQTKARYNELLRRRHMHFPPNREHVLPTSFGNTIRAFEQYSKAMYEADSIPIWTRLLGVMPAEYQQMLEGRSAQLDFAVNSFFLTLLLTVEYSILVYRTGDLSWLYGVGAVLVGLLVFFYEMAIGNAIQYGNAFKASFDLYRLDLLTKMGFKPPKNLSEEKGMWAKVSRSFLYWEELKLERAVKEEEPKSPVPAQTVEGLFFGRVWRDKKENET